MRSKIFRAFLTALILFSFSQAFSQNYAETALLFSRTRPGGSARIQALGGSQIALGGDYSSALSNPAGLGMFNRSEFTFSAGLSSHNTFSSYLGNETNDEKSVINVPGVSVVWHMPKDREGFFGGSLAITLSRTNDFNRSTLYSGKNDNNSIVDYFIDQAYGATTAQFDENAAQYNTPTGLAYFNYLIGPKSILNPPGPNNEYFTDAGYPDNQQEEIFVKGASNQWSISYGGNIQDKFFFGGGIGISSLRYKSQKVFSETFRPGNTSDPDTLEYLQLNENLDIRGSGVNATFGAIIRPVNFVQFGVSFVTPTFYNLTEVYDASLATRWDNFDYYGDGSTTDKTPFLNNESASTDIITSDYNLTTPLKFSSGVAFITKYGFLTGDIELTNPAKAKYSSDTPGISYSNDNKDIKAMNQPVVNYRIGAEFKYEIFRLRAGYGVQGSTYRNTLAPDSLKSNNTITSLSGGFGVRTKKFYVDFALVNSKTNKYFYHPYTFYDGSGPTVGLKDRSTTGLITLGFIF